MPLNEAEQKFFESNGEQTEGLTDKPANETAVAVSETPAEEVAESLTETPVDFSHETQPDKPDDEKSKAQDEKVKAELTARRKEAIESLGLVPKEALSEARQEQKAMREELNTVRNQMMQFYQQLAQAPVPQGEQVPDQNEDPLGYMNWAVNQLAQRAQEAENWRQQQQAREQQQVVLRQVANWATQQEEVFRKEVPDYDDAYKFAAEARERELQAIHDDPAVRQQIIAQDIEAILVQATQTGRNPAKMVYDYAMAKGYAKKPVQDPTKVVKQIQAGQEASGGLRGGQAPAGKVSAQELAAIDTSTAAGKKRFEATWKEMFG